ncbi:MAG: hypothetical protein WC612_06085 [Bdellovibrionales bacterium]|jgi:hypothetical protein
MTRSFSLSLLTLLLACFWGAGEAQAGALFPPQGAVLAGGPDGPIKVCPSGQTFLKWTGEAAACGKVSQEVTIPNCPPGQMLIGVTNGNHNCVPPPPPKLGPVYTMHFGDMGWSLLNCPDGYVMTGAGGWANTGTNIYMNCRQLQ